MNGLSDSAEGEKVPVNGHFRAARFGRRLICCTDMRFIAAFLALPIWVLGQQVSFTKSVRPVLAERCAPCHNDRNASGKVSLASVAAMTKAGALVAGKPDESLLVKVISGDRPRMPKFGDPLKAEQVDAIRRWIAAGAPDDSTAGGPEVWWSLAPEPAAVSAGRRSGGRSRR